MGIDLGHQFTKAIMVAPGIAFDVIFTDEGKRKDASTLYIKPSVEGLDLKDAERLYGAQIGSLCTRFPASCASNLKALLGKDVSDDAVRHYIKHHPGVQVVGDADRNNSVMLQLGTAPQSYSFSVEELMGMSLNNLKLRVLKALDSHPQARSVADDVAVSVPPYADQVTRLAYLDALQLGEYSTILGLVDEGVAAALAYVSGRKFTPEEYDEKKSYHVIYDVGAGSTTATLFSYTPYKNKTVGVEIESFGFDSSFGGELLTHNVYDILYLKFLSQFGLDDSTVLPPKLIARLIETSEKAKTVLSANSDTRVSLESFYNDKDFKAAITRQEFEDYSSDAAERAIKPIIDALNQATSEKVSISSIDSVILNGGSTRTPFIQKQLVALLGGDEKISKVVNTDEACALGTTIRAYQLKMTSGTPDIILKDRIFSNFEISINNSDQLQLVFAKGSESGNKTEIVLGGLNDEINVSLYENSALFQTYSLPNVTKKADSLKCSSKDISVVGVFEIDQNKIFSLSEVTLRCPKKKDSSALSSTTNSEKSNSTKVDDLKELPVHVDSFLNFTKPKPRTQVNVPVSDSHYANLRPLNSTEKKAISVSLRKLRAKDEEKIALQERKNELESLCYGLRSFVEDNYDDLMAETGEDDLETAKSLVSEIIEWLEYESDEATFEDIEFKKVILVGKKEALSRVHKMVEANLSLPELKKMYDEGQSVSSQVEKYLQEYNTQLADIKKQYHDGGFDYQAEDDKVLTKIYGLKSKKAMALGGHFDDFQKALETLRKIVNLSSKKFQALAKEELFEASEGVTSLIYKMMDDVVSLQKKHEERLEYLMTKLDKLKKRQAQKEFRLKKKEEAASKAANSTAGESQNGTPLELKDQKLNGTTPDSADEQSSAEPESTPKATDVDHDEL